MDNVETYSFDEDNFLDIINKMLDEQDEIDRRREELLKSKETKSNGKGE